MQEEVKVKSICVYCIVIVAFILKYHKMYSISVSPTLSTIYEITVLMFIMFNTQVCRHYLYIYVRVCMCACLILLPELLNPWSVPTDVGIEVALARFLCRALSICMALIEAVCT